MKATLPSKQTDRLHSTREIGVPGGGRRSKPRTPCWMLSLALLSASPLFAQVPDSSPPAAAPAGGAPATQNATPSQKPAEKKEFSLSRDGAGFDPGSEVMSFDGKNWNVNNNRLFEARFEKYLNAPEETTAEDRQYQAYISQILVDLAPGNATNANIDGAFRLLFRASRYDIDARLCDSIADAVYSVSKSFRHQEHLAETGRALIQERDQQYWRARHLSAGEAQNTGNTTTTGSGKNAKTQSTKQSYEDTTAQAQSAARLTELEAKTKINDTVATLTEIATKVEYDALILQLFLQRRFQHVLIATRFYRAMFTDGDTKLNVDKETENTFKKMTGVVPTLGTIDSLANEALRDVREGVQAFNFSLQNNELYGATKRLQEAFVEGEYLPEIRTLPREKKHQALDFSHKSYQLISALDVKDYTLAEQLVTELSKTAKDFDASKPTGLIETSKVGAQLHLAKARNAALKGDNQTLETELNAAAEIWPRNPQLAEVSKMIFSQGGDQQKAYNDFDNLYREKNYRLIYEDASRFGAATAQDPDRQTKLKEVVESMKTIEMALVQSNVMAQQSNYAGAWECVEKVSAQYSDDNKLSQARANLTTQAADFVRTIRGAQDLEKKDLLGSSLAWYLKAKKLFPASEFANEGIDRLVKKILPES